MGAIFPFSVHCTTEIVVVVFGLLLSTTRTQFALMVVRELDLGIGQLNDHMAHGS